MIEEYWAEFVAATGIDGAYEAWAFGDADAMPELSTALALLVRDGPKRATASLLEEFTADGSGEQPPEPGDLSVILDGEGRPTCVIRTVQVETRRFGDVDEAFAWDEGEGDRTLEWWRRAHQWFFSQQGVEIDDDTLMVLERFELLWPEPDDASSVAARS